MSTETADSACSARQSVARQDSDDSFTNLRFRKAVNKMKPAVIASRALSPGGITTFFRPKKKRTIAPVGAVVLATTSAHYRVAVPPANDLNMSSGHIGEPTTSSPEQASRKISWDMSNEP